MMAVMQPITKVTPADRLGLTLVFALILHATVILGITFSATDKNQESMQTLEITLVQQKSAESPDDAEFLAQANLAGSGDQQQTSLPSSRPSTPSLSSDNGASTATTPPAPQPQSREQTAQFVLTGDIADEKTIVDDASDEVNVETPNAAELVAKSMEIANLSAVINQSMESYAKRPKHRYITSRARQYRDAAYLDAWRTKIERIGNLNYPEEAKQRRLSGTLILDVALNPDGSINAINLRRSSGEKLLDDAAKRIVTLAAPFAPFPEEMRTDTDILHITRTWQFINGDQLVTSH